MGKIKIKLLEALSFLIKHQFVKPLILFIGCFIFYGNTIPNNYALDDGTVIMQNKFTKSGIVGIPGIFKYDTFYGSYGEDVKHLYGGRYRPLSLATFAIEYQFFKENPNVSHFMNIIFLFLAALVLYKLLLKIFNSYQKNNNFFDLSLITTLLFIAHPVHTEVIANIKGRDEIMAMLGSLTAILFILKYIDTNKYKYLVVSFIFYFLALLSKENSIMFLAIIPLSIYFYKKEKWVKYLISLAPACLAAVLFLILRRFIIGEPGPVPNELLNNPYLFATFSEKYATIFYTLGKYIKLLFWPHPLTYDYNPYHIALVNWNNIFALFSLLVYTSLTIFAFLTLKKKTIVSFGILFYMITLSIVSNLFFPVGTFMSERFIFMPSIGFLLIMSWLLVKYVKSGNIRITVLTVLMTLGFIKTYGRNKIWEDNTVLFTTDVETSSNSVKSNMYASGVYLDFAKIAEDRLNDSFHKEIYLEKALIYSRKAVSICPEHVDVVGSLAEVYAANNILDSAIYCYRKAIKLMPDRANFLSTKIEEIMDKISDTNFQIENYQSLVILAPNNFIFNFQLGNLFGRYKHDFVKSSYYLKRAVEIMPGDYLVNMIYGINCRLLGDYNKSAFYLEKALKINPNYLPIYENLSIVYKLSGNTRKETAALKKIEELKNGTN